MYTQVWSKYVPVIKILLKRSLNGNQVLNLNATDFERAGAARKSGYKFQIQFHNGRVNNIISASPLASELASLLLQESTVKDLLSQHDYHISMNPKFQLDIKHIPKENEEHHEVADAVHSGSNNG